MGFCGYSCCILNLWQISHTCVTGGGIQVLCPASNLSYVCLVEALDKYCRSGYGLHLYLGFLEILNWQSSPQLISRNLSQLQEIKEGSPLFAASCLMPFWPSLSALFLPRDCSPWSLDDLFSSHCISNASLTSQSAAQIISFGFILLRICIPISPFLSHSFLERLVPIFTQSEKRPVSNLLKELIFKFSGTHRHTYLRELMLIIIPYLCYSCFWRGVCATQVYTMLVSIAYRCQFYCPSSDGPPY